MNERPRRDPWVSRKTWAFFVTLLISVVLLVASQIDQDHFVQIIVVLVPSYIAGNIAEHFSNSWRDRSRPYQSPFD